MSGVTVKTMKRPQLAVKTDKLQIKMSDKIRLFQVASEMTGNGYKWSGKSKGYD